VEIKYFLHTVPELNYFIVFKEEDNAHQRRYHQLGSWNEDTETETTEVVCIDIRVIRTLVL